MWLLEFLKRLRIKEEKAGSNDTKPGEGEISMEKDLFTIVLALVISAVWKTDLLQTVAIVEIADRIFRLLRYSYIVTERSRKEKSPSSSAKRNGRLRKRN